MITNQRSFKKRAKKKLLKPLNFLINPLQDLWLNKNTLIIYNYTISKD